MAGFCSEPPFWSFMVAGADSGWDKRPVKKDIWPEALQIIYAKRPLLWENQKDKEEQDGAAI